VITTYGFVFDPVAWQIVTLLCALLVVVIVPIAGLLPPASTVAA
jgi:hypothetical protein